MKVVPEAFCLGKRWELLPPTCLGQIIGSNHGIAADLRVVAFGGAQRGADGGDRRDADENS